VILASRRTLAWLGVAAGIGLCLFLLLPGPFVPLRQAVRTRVFSFSQPQQDDSVSFRQTAARIGWQMFRQHPWVGLGAGAYAQKVPAYLPPNYYAPSAMLTHIHNLYLQVLVETGSVGLLGFLVWVGYYILTQIRAWQTNLPARQRTLLLGCLAATAAFLIHNAFDVLTVFARGAHWAVILGLGTALARQANPSTLGSEREKT
jgi:O-antigen ligase